MHMRSIYQKNLITCILAVRGRKRVKWGDYFIDNHLNRFSLSASSFVQPCVQPEKASISISYLRCSTIKGPFPWRMWTNLCPKSSIWGVNLSAWKLAWHLIFWRSRGIILFANLASVFLKCISLCFSKSGKICIEWNQGHQGKQWPMLYFYRTSLILSSSCRCSKYML